MIIGDLEDSSWLIWITLAKLSDVCEPRLELKRFSSVAYRELSQGEGLEKRSLKF